MVDRARTLTEEAPSIEVPWLLALRVRILFHGKSCSMAIINDPIPVANIRSYIVDQETGLPNFVMIQSAPHLPLAAGIEQTKKAKKKKTSTHLERKSFIYECPSDAPAAVYPNKQLT